MIQKCFQYVLLLGVMGLPAACCPQQEVNKENLADVLLNDPAAAMAWANAVDTQCTKEMKTEGIYKSGWGLLFISDPKRVREYREKFEQQCPIFLLGECTATDWGACSLSRTHDPSFRKKFEDCAVASLGNKLQVTNGPVQYVGLGCGGMFQDHVILTKTLARNPHAQLDIHLIDTKHNLYVASRDLLKNTRVIDPVTPANIQPVLPALVKRLREEEERNRISKDIPGANDAALEAVAHGLCEMPGTLARQSIAWLSKTFPSARLRLHLHETVESYWQYRDQERIATPDVIATADIDDGDSWLKGAHHDHKWLCVKALQHKADMHNVWLKKDDKHEEGAAALASVSLKTMPDSFKEEVKIDGVMISVYTRVQRLAKSSMAQ